MDSLNFTDSLPKPYHDASLNLIYNLLFCDHIGLYKQNSTQQDHYPWSTLFSEKSNISDLEKIIDDDKAESRVKILAYNLLRERGEHVNTKKLLGVIVEVGLDQGLDVLASFRDGGARYINHTGKMIIWETSNATSEAFTNQLFADSENIVKQIGPYDKPRRPHPVRGMVRLTFLVSDGLYFGEGPITFMFNDTLAGPALMSATKLMQFLTENAIVSHVGTESTERKSN